MAGAVKDPRFASVFEVAPYAALVVEGSGRISAINRAARQLLSADVVADCSLSKLLNGDAERVAADLAKATTGDAVSLTLRANDGPMLFTVAALEDRNESRELLLTQQAPPAVNELSQELDRANTEAADARLEQRKLQESFETLKRFSALAAHDLKAPLRHMALFIHLLEQEQGDSLSDQAREYLDSLRGVSDRLRNLVSSLMAHARAGADDLVKEPVALDDVVATLQREMGAAFREVGGELHVLQPLGTVQGDPDLVERLLANLLDNAVKYRAADRALQVEVQTHQQEGRVVGLIVQDNGRGFSNENREKLFEPFIRLHSKVDIEGTGLGLATCLTICRRHGWALEASGEIDRGARFSIHM